MQEACYRLAQESQDATDWAKRNTFDELERVLLLAPTQTGLRWAGAVAKVVDMVNQGFTCGTSDSAKTLFRKAIRIK